MLLRIIAFLDDDNFPRNLLSLKEILKKSKPDFVQNAFFSSFSGKKMTIVGWFTMRRFLIKKEAIKVWRWIYFFALCVCVHVRVYTLMCVWCIKSKVCLNESVNVGELFSFYFITLKEILPNYFHSLLLDIIFSR